MSKFKKITKKGKFVGNPIRKCQNLRKYYKEGKIWWKPNLSAEPKTRYYINLFLMPRVRPCLLG
jgi:hypothetical protein